MRLLIVRHAIAVPRGTPGIPDAERPLTEEGVARFEEATAGLARLVERPVALLSSPWRRARQTAAILAGAWKGLETTEAEALASGSFEELARVVDRYPADGTVVVVGHEPHLSALLARLLGSRRDERFAFKKGGAALVELPGRLGDGGSLVFFLGPKLLKKIG